MYMQINLRNNSQRGYTMVETLFYAAGMLVLLAVMTTFLYYMYDWYRNVTIEPHADRAGVQLVDKIIKDIRTGTAINSGQSAFNTTNGALSLSTLVSGAAVTKYFAVSNGRLTYQQNGGTVSYLSPTDVTISRFYITSTSTAISQGIRFDIDISYRLRTGTSTRTYSGFTLLRQSYD